jgi:hypothetical protein
MNEHETRCAHLQMIQGVVSRLSNNSFLLKGWSVVLISGLFALAAKDTKPLFIYIAYFPCIVFWGLDGYFLCQERRFRALYDVVRTESETPVTFSMDVQPISGEIVWLDSVFSKTLIAFHGVVLSVILVVMGTLLAAH